MGNLLQLANPGEKKPGVHLFMILYFLFSGLLVKLPASLKHELLLYTVYTLQHDEEQLVIQAEVLVLLGRHAKLAFGSAKQSPWNTMLKHSR